MSLEAKSEVTEYECGDKNQPHYHDYKTKDAVGHFEIENEKYVMNVNVDKRTDACCDAKSAIISIKRKDIANFKCLWDIWKNRVCNHVVKKKKLCKE